MYILLFIFIYILFMYTFTENNLTYLFNEILSRIKKLLIIINKLT